MLSQYRVLGSYLFHKVFMALQFLVFFLFSFFKKDLFTYLRGRERERFRGAVEEGERISSRLPTECGAWHGAWSHDPEIMTWAEIKSWMLNRLSHPGALGDLRIFTEINSSPYLFHSFFPLSYSPFLICFISLAIVIVGFCSSGCHYFCTIMCPGTVLGDIYRHYFI